MALIYPLGLASTDFSDSQTGPGYEPQNYAYGGHFVLGSAGTVTQFGVKGFVNGGGTVNVKFGLYNSGGSLVGSGTGAMTGLSDIWHDSGAVSISVPSAGTYYVLVSAELDTVKYGIETSGNGSFATEAYATFPASSETITDQGDTGQLYGVRMDFTAGAAGPTGAQLSRMLLGIG